MRKCSCDTGDINVMETKIIMEHLELLDQTARKLDCFWRASYTEEDRKGVDMLKTWMEEGGLAVSFDPVGNLFGRVKGATGQMILIGSHRDTVRNGGKYDGALGVLTAIEAASSLYREFGKPEKTIEVAAFCEEEGSRYLSGFVGSRGVAGILDPLDLEESDSAGVTLREAIRGNGYAGDFVHAEKHAARFVELHIEQGGILEQQGMTIGAVTAICGITVGSVRLEGEQNHAGTTPMSLRKDPMAAAAGVMDRMFRWSGAQNDRVTCTFGNLTCFPGISNVIPRVVEFCFDIRSQDSELLAAAKGELRKYLDDLQGVRYQIAVLCDDEPVQMDPGGIRMIRQTADELGYPCMEIASGAGHDSQILAGIMRTNRLFVPSRAGISHSRDEYTSPEDIAAGYQVLKEYIRKIAWEEQDG